MICVQVREANIFIHMCHCLGADTVTMSSCQLNICWWYPIVYIEKNIIDTVSQQQATAAAERVLSLWTVSSSVCVCINRAVA
jgi:hypothetical protein